MTHTGAPSDHVQATDHHVRCEQDRVGTLAGPHRSRLRHQARLVSVVEPDPDLFRCADDDLAQLVQRLVALHPCRTVSNHQHPHLFHRPVPPLRENDLIIGKGKSAIGTLVERQTRYVMLFKVPKGNKAEDVRVALTATIKRLPEHLWQSLTWDQGTKMAQHAQFTVDTGVQVYFCDLKSPWQRGSNENTTGCYASTSRKAPTCRSSPKKISTRPPTRSTPGLVKPSAT